MVNLPVCAHTDQRTGYSPYTPPHSQVVTDGNVSLGDDEIDILVVLRMNREFMKFGRQYYAHRLNEPFNIF